MSKSSNRQARRYRPSSARLSPSQLARMGAARKERIGIAELAGCGAVVIVAGALIVLTWLLTIGAVQDQQAEIRDRAEQALKARAAIIAETVAHELLVIDQSLSVIQQAWKADSDSVDLGQWQQTMPALLSVADDLFIADDKRIIRQDILPKAVGQGVGAAYVTFPHGSLEQYQSDGTRDKELLLLQGDPGEPVDARQFLMYVIRPLDHPKGWLVGASYRSGELTKLFAAAALGSNSVVALVDTRRGMLQAVVGPAARRPKTNMSQSPLFGAITHSPSGTWLGDTAIDDVERIHAFHQVADRDMTVVVAANWSEVMALANDLAASARAMAFVGSALILLISGLVVWELTSSGTKRRQKRAFERDRIEIERLRAEEANLIANARLSAALLKVALENIADGIALFDTGFQLVEWNYPLSRGIGVDLLPNMPLDSLLRAQAANGLLGSLDDVEAEVARRFRVLRNGDADGLAQRGPGGETLILRGLPIAEGGFMLLLSGSTLWEPAPSSAAATEIDVSPAAEPLSSVPIEW